jgi:hypothetical protein
MCYFRVLCKCCDFISSSVHNIASPRTQSSSLLPAVRLRAQASQRISSLATPLAMSAAPRTLCLREGRYSVLGGLRSSDHPALAIWCQKEPRLAPELAGISYSLTVTTGASVAASSEGEAVFDFGDGQSTRGHLLARWLLLSQEEEAITAGQHWQATEGRGCSPEQFPAILASLADDLNKAVLRRKGRKQVEAMSTRATHWATDMAMAAFQARPIKHLQSCDQAACVQADIMAAMEEHGRQEVEALAHLFEDVIVIGKACRAVAVLETVMPQAISEGSSAWHVALGQGV